MEEKTNSFSQKMALKSDAHLQDIVSDMGYDENARLAAAWELEKRGKADTASKAAEHRILEGQKEQKLAMPVGGFLPSLEKDQAVTEDPAAPLLYSSKAIYGFSVIFSPIFGAVLLRSNLKKLDMPGPANFALFAGILYTVLVMVVIESLANPSSTITIAMNAGGALMMKEFIWNKYIGKDFELRKKSIVKPLIISVLITVPILLAMIYGY